ncbi:MAG TPA: Sec-independent protein translocase protein TatB [Thermodesulfobacteriota bacterium]|jgi:sec-independent protein translocase protein TatB|nr:Sec-independent protein translocase protein TatB [Thermodesulfobacteriota bacterium]
MFGIGTSEILIILLIAILVLGPKEIPKIARTIGRGMRQLQRAKDELRQTLDKDFYDDEEEDTKPTREDQEGKKQKLTDENRSTNEDT